MLLRILKLHINLKERTFICESIARTWWIFFRSQGRMLHFIRKTSSAMLVYRSPAAVSDWTAFAKPIGNYFYYNFTIWSWFILLKTGNMNLKEEMFGHRLKDNNGCSLFISTNNSRSKRTLPKQTEAKLRTD
jgi:hypothetical protein